MRTGYPHIKKTGTAIAIHLAVCMLVYGFFGFGFYKMFQPLQFPNPGLAAYKPPPATVITYAATANLIYGEQEPSETATEEPSHDACEKRGGNATGKRCAASRRKRVKLIRRERSGPPRPGLIPSHAASPLFIKEDMRRSDEPMPLARRAVGIMREREPRGSSRNYCFCRLGLGTTEEVSSACAITAYTT